MISKSKPLTILSCLLFLWSAAGLLSAAEKAVTEEKPPVANEGAEETGKKEVSKNTASEESKPEIPLDEDKDPKMVEDEEVAVAVAKPLLGDPVQVYGWREWVAVSDGKQELKMPAKLDTGALTSSIHAENLELFERDGKKWVRFVVSVTGSDEKDLKKLRIEAPLVRIAKIKEPGGESEMREVVRLGFKIGGRKVKAEFTLNDRSNMLNPVLIGRRTIKELGWVDAGRAYLADKKVMR